NQQLIRARISGLPNYIPPAAQTRHCEAGGIVVLANGDPARIAADIVDAYGMALPSAGSGKSWTLTGSGCPLGCHSRPPFLKLPTNSFFLVSTETTGR